jgi:hypothetical protein
MNEWWWWRGIRRKQNKHFDLFNTSVYHRRLTVKKDVTRISGWDDSVCLPESGCNLIVIVNYNQEITLKQSITKFLITILWLMCERMCYSANIKFLFFVLLQVGKKNIYLFHIVLLLPIHMAYSSKKGPYAKHVTKSPVFSSVKVARWIFVQITPKNIDKNYQNNWIQSFSSMIN